MENLTFIECHQLVLRKPVLLSFIDVRSTSTGPLDRIQYLSKTATVPWCSGTEDMTVIGGVDG